MWQVIEEFGGDVPEPLPDTLRARRRLPPLTEALRQAHFPATEAERARAIGRLAFEDFLLLQLGLAILRSRTTRATGAYRGLLLR